MTMHIPGWLFGSAAALVLSAAVRALPDPDPEPGGSKFYLWLFRFTHFVLANFDKVGVSNGNQSRGN